MPAGENSAKIPKAVLDRLRAGQLLLTPNQRAARTLRRTFDERMQIEGYDHWIPANVLAVSTWLENLWHQLLLNGHEHRLVLNSTQQHALWHDLIVADPEVSGLRSPDLLAEMAADAWSTACLHHGRRRLREFGISVDTKAFQRWAQDFERRAQRNSYLTPAQLPEALSFALGKGTLSLPENLTLVDFDDLTPSLEAFLSQIDQAGYPVTRLQTTLHSTRHLVTAPDDEAELKAAALWARRHLDQDASARIAIVVPNLADRRTSLARTFANLLTPEAQPITASASAPIFEFSLGLPLTQTASITTALDLLRWCLHPLSLEAISALLLSPFLAASSPDQLAAADFDVHTLRRTPLLRPELSLEAFLELASASSPRRGPSLPPTLLTQLRTLLHTAYTEHLDDPAAQQSHEDWSDAFRAALESSGWTAATNRDSLTYQTRQRFESVLDEMATLDFEPVRSTAAEALRQLTRIAQQTIFAPESTEAPVQILGPLELGGISFDYLWFLSADDLTWPILSSTNPLIPWSVQQSLGIPGTDATRDRHQAQAMTARIAASAPEVVCSYAQHAEEGARRPSTLLLDLELKALELHAFPEVPPPVLLLEHLDLEPIAALPDAVIEGGASILQAQAACAFRAFAEKRLRSAEPETTQAGLNPRDRGTIVHDVMEHFWRKLGDQPALIALPFANRVSLLEQSIDYALTRTSQRARTSWERAYVDVQRKRLLQLLLPWLEVEANRPPFTVTEHEREEKGLTIGPLQLTVRIDRVDETEDGPLILDYKTGEASTAQWLTDRPDQPQIPLYAVLSTTPPAGVAFALMRPGDGLALRGFADSPLTLAKTSSQKLPLSEQVQEWHRILTHLAEDFAAGAADVAPKCYPKTCQHCAQRILCRLDHSNLEDVADEAEEPNYV